MSNILSRIHDLRIWQRHHDSNSKKVKQNSKGNVPSQLNCETMDQSKSTDSFQNMTLEDMYDKVLPTPPKTFEELLSEKLLENAEPLEIPTVEKKPYLKKGSGLQRYGLLPGKKPTFVHKDTKRSRCCSRQSSDGKSEVRTSNPQHGSPHSNCLKSNITKTKQPTQVVIQHSTNNMLKRVTAKATAKELSPLKAPSLNIEVRGKWLRVGEENQLPKQVNPNHISPNDKPSYDVNALKNILKNSTYQRPSAELQPSINSNQKCYENFKESICYNSNVETPVAPVLTNNCILNITSPYRNSNVEVQPSEQTLYERQLEKELMMFELLEEKAENSSFCSTNSSVLQLLMNTPTKLWPKSKQPQIEEEPSGPTTPIMTSNAVQCTEFRTSDFHVDMLEKIKALLQDNISKIVEQQAKSENLSSNNEHNGIKPQPVAEEQDIPENNNTLEQDEVPSKENDQHVNRTRNNSETIFSDEEKWSSIGSSAENSLIETLASGDVAECSTPIIEVKDASTNTLPIIEPRKISVPCQTCGDELSKKLLELNKEIAGFRSDKTELQAMKNQLQDEKMLFEKEMHQLRRDFEQEKSKLFIEFEEQKKKLAKEKMVFERYVKDAHHRPDRREREEISNLKIEVANLKETLKLKETKNGTTQARLRTQIKQLERNNQELKDEIDKLTKQNAKLVANQRVNPKISDTKIIHEINKNLTKIARKALRKHPSDSDEEKNNLNLSSKAIINPSERLKKQNSKLSDPEDEPNIGIGMLRCEPEILLRRENTQTSLENITSNMNDTTFPEHKNCEEVEKDYEKVFGSGKEEDFLKKNTSENSTYKKHTMEDGTVIYEYDTGGVKTVSPDGNYIVMRYPNGDVKETNLVEGATKYMFSYNKCCHVVFADGTEMLEFPSGQTEKKYKDGRTEVYFANGINKVIFPNGIEETYYPDGTKVQLKNGNKVLWMANGQREVHTDNQKRREYPDGTVKILYNDGRQETRYASGRIRIKDKDGVLIMDTQTSY